MNIRFTDDPRADGEFCIKKFCTKVNLVYIFFVFVALTFLLILDPLNNVPNPVLRPIASAFSNVFFYLHVISSILACILAFALATISIICRINNVWAYFKSSPIIFSIRCLTYLATLLFTITGIVLALAKLKASHVSFNGLPDPTNVATFLSNNFSFVLKDGETLHVNIQMLHTHFGCTLAVLIGIHIYHHYTAT